MKKLFLFLFFLFFSTGLFAETFWCDGPYVFKRTLQGSDCTDFEFASPSSIWTNKPSKWACTFMVKTNGPYQSNKACTGKPYVNPDLNPPDAICSFDSNGVLSCNKNPDPLGGQTCREGFVKDGQYHNCNPNTNESELVLNSNDYELNENQTPYPKCNDGFVNDSTLVVSGGGASYTKQSCVVPAPDPESGSGTTNPVLDGVTTVTNADGSTTITWGDGTTQTVQTNGSSVTKYPDGTTTSSGGGGSTGGGSGSASSGGSPTPPTGANTPNETNPNTNDTPVDTAPVANSCTSSNLTLQEKMMCEMNAGMKKLNSESSTQNSLNNLLKDLNSSNSQSLTAVNKNIKYTNDNLEVINKNTNQTNQNLEVVANKVNQSNSELKSINETLKNIETNTKDTSTNTSRTISVGGGTGETSGDGETPGETVEDVDNPISSVSSTHDFILDQFTTFKYNLLDKRDNLENLLSGAKNTLNNGFSFTLNSNDLTTCNENYILELTSLGLSDINLNIDICQQTSKLKPYLSPLFTIMFFLGISFFAFRMIGVFL